MRLLLDTHLLLWMSRSEAEENRLSPQALDLIEDPGNTPVFSASSIWEVAIKRSLNRPDFRTDPSVLRRGLLDNGYEELPVTGEHAAVIVTLPQIHRDPFDRILIAQAMSEGVILLTADATLAAYGSPVRRV